jgi:DNA helicase II / ATP-dependent DNA helicase PcrA
MFIDRIGYGQDFVIYDSDDCLRVVKDIMKKQNIDDKEFNPRAVHGMISKAKGEWLSPSDFSATVDSYAKSVTLEVYKEYAGRLKADNALDFDDLLLLFRRILDLPEVLEYFHNRFQYFMVDEYQDTNMLQYEIVRILASKTKNLCVVGDDWQGIYSWRGADIENILSFKKDYPNAMVINLEENYRSTQIIIDAANAVIKNNTNQMKKTLFTSNPVGEKIVILEGIDEKHEADLITNVIRDMVSVIPGLSRDPGNHNESSFAGSPHTRGWQEPGDKNYSDFAILYRTNGQSRLLEESLIRKNIPYRVFGGVKFYERKEIKDILAYIRIIFNPLDSMSLKRIINVPGRKIGEKSLENFLEVLERERLSVAEFCENQFLIDSLTGIGAKGIAGFCSLYQWLRELSKKSSVAELMDNIIKRTGYEAYLKSEYTEEEFDGKMENLDEFLNMASRYDGLIYPENIASFLEDIALITDQDRDQEDKQKADTGYVSLMTIHLSKWLEYPTIFIAGAEEGIFPHSRSLVDSSQLEEERRLMYVAITRAKTELYISRAHERYTFGNYSANPKSRFIKEIPAEYLEVESNRGSAQSIFGSGAGGFSTFQSSFLKGAGEEERRDWGFSGFWDSILHQGQGGLGFQKNQSSASQAQQLDSRGAKKPKNSASQFATGSRVKHAQYGVGTIVTIDGAIASIAFSGLGIKKMNVEIAPIELV